MMKITMATAYVHVQFDITTYAFDLEYFQWLEQRHASHSRLRDLRNMSGDFFVCATILSDILLAEEGGG